MLHDQLETIGTEEASKILRCSEAETEQLARDGDIPGIKYGRAWLFVRKDLVAYIAEEARAQARKRRDMKSRGSANGTMGMEPKPNAPRGRRTPPALPSPIQ